MTELSGLKGTFKMNGATYRVKDGQTQKLTNHGGFGIWVDCVTPIFVEADDVLAGADKADL